LFVFEPPADARHVEDLKEARENPQSWIGRDAIDFLLPDLAGQPVKLADARGQVILLDFWASWCLPCRQDMPRIEALYRELYDRGLRVFGVNSEPAETADAYMKENGYTFPSLLDRNMGVSRNYGVASLPTVVVVDREGKISAYLDGARSAEELRQAVLDAGL
jgi:peroxiredoxin